MAAPADIGVRMAGLAFLRVGFCRQAMAVANPRQRVIFGLTRMTFNTRRIFVAHAASLRVRTIGKPMLLFVVSGVISGIRGWLMAHNAVFGCIFAVVANEAVFHLRIDHVAIEVFPFGNAGVTAAAFEFFMLFMGKNEIFSEASAGAHCLAGLFEMAETAVALLAGLEMAFKTALFTGAPESVVDLDLLRKNAADARSNNVGRPQWLPAWGHRWHNCFAAFTVNMADSTVNRILFVSLM